MIDKKLKGRTVGYAPKHLKALMLLNYNTNKEGEYVYTFGTVCTPMYKFKKSEIYDGLFRDALVIGGTYQFLVSDTNTIKLKKMIKRIIPEAINKNKVIKFTCVIGPQIKRGDGSVFYYNIFESALHILEPSELVRNCDQHVLLVLEDQHKQFGEKIRAGMVVEVTTRRTNRIVRELGDISTHILTEEIKEVK